MGQRRNDYFCRAPRLRSIVALRRRTLSPMTFSQEVFREASRSPRRSSHTSTPSRAFVFYDVETDGHSQARITALGAVGERTGAAGFYSLVNPQRPCSARAAEIHCLADERLAEAPTFDAVFDAFVEWTRGQGDGEIVLVGWNSKAADEPCLRREAARFDRDLSTLSCSGRVLFADLMPRTNEHRRRVFESPALNWSAGSHTPKSGRPSLTLDNVFQLLNPGEAQRHHDALWDAEATRAVWRCEMFRELCDIRPLEAVDEGRHRGRRSATGTAKSDSPTRTRPVECLDAPAA